MNHLVGDTLLVLLMELNGIRLDSSCKRLDFWIFPLDYHPKRLDSCSFRLDFHSKRPDYPLQTLYIEGPSLT
ncbi:hypothetical protein [Rossellomorea vietnamensis]|uniref:hypothetical protein n=1 Tax=Rossellomorea vietnamensis TaxID=218284 RepID=UPI003D2A80AD